VTSQITSKSEPLTATINTRAAISMKNAENPKATEK